MAYKYETHLHTVEGSACASSPAIDYISAYIEKGYSGIIVTDHFWGGNTCVNRELVWEEWVNQYCSGYEHALEYAERLNKERKTDFKVFFGFEQTFQGDDYLVYGLDKNWLLEHRNVIKMNHKELFAEVNKANGLMIQAHPFRFRQYMAAMHQHPIEVHGVEVYNAGNKPIENQMAELYAKAFDFPVTSGSDIHTTNFIEPQPGKNNLGGMEFDSPLTGIFDYAARIKNHEGKIIF